MGRLPRRGAASRRSGKTGKAKAAGPPPVVLDAKTRSLLAGIDHAQPQKRASACDALEAALSMGTMERRQAIAAHVLGSGGIEKVLSLLHDPFAHVCVSAASAVRCLASAGGPDVCELLASTSAPIGLLHCLAKACSPQQMAISFKTASTGDGFESGSVAPLAAASTPSALAPGAAVAKPATGALRLQLAQEVIGAVNELAKGSDSAVASMLAIAHRGDVAWPPTGEAVPETSASLPLKALLGPMMTCMELPPQANASGAWGAAGSVAASAAAASSGSDPTTTAGFHAQAMSVCSSAQTAAAETLHTLADGTPALAAALISAPGALTRLSAVMADTACVPLARLHIAGALLCVAASASHTAGAAAGLPEEAGRAAAAALNTALAAVSVEITGPELRIAFEADAELQRAQAVLEGSRGDATASAAAEAAASSASGASAATGGVGGAAKAIASGPEERSPDEIALAEATAEEEAVESAEKASGSARSAWEDARSGVVTLACQVLSSAVSGRYAVRGTSVEGADEEDVEVVVEGVQSGSVAVLGASDAIAVVDRALLAILSLLNGTTATGGSVEASAVLTTAWARHEAEAAGEAMSSLRGTIAHSLVSGDIGGMWARLQTLLAAADWRAPAGSTPAVVFARGVAAKSCLPGLLAAAQASMEGAIASKDATAIAAAAAAATTLAPALCTTAGEAVAAASSGKPPVTPTQARSLSLACLSQLPGLSPALLSNAAALTAIAGALDGGLQDPELEVVAEALNCAFDVFGADGDQVLATAKAVGLCAKIQATAIATRRRLSSAEATTLEPDTRARCVEMVQNGIRFAEYLRSSGAV